MGIKRVARALVIVVFVEVVGVIGSIFTTPAIPTWYVTLNKPSFNPPNWIFAPVWTLLYLSMGISAFLIWEKGINKKEVRIALLIFSGQLVLNVLWSYLFFGLKSPSLAFVGIIVLWLAIAATIYAFYKISKPAGLILIPYILWVTFAAFLNFSILMLN
jgi:translocator protein